MTAPQDLASGKGSHDENFPVASFLVQRDYRPPILAFYDFVRIADDVSDHPTAPAEEKLRLLEDLRLSLAGQSDVSPQGVKLRAVLTARGLSLTHADEMLEAFRRDCTKLRYADWAELLDYCRYSAMPVGRFVLDVHGESRDLWPVSDALCAALQVINHLQDCGKDYRALNRVYLPLDICARHGADPVMLKEAASPPPLRAVQTELAEKTLALLKISAPFAASIRNAGLSFEVAMIQTLAEDLTRKLLRRDPLCDRVHHCKLEIAGLFLQASTRFLAGRLRAKRPAA